MGQIRGYRERACFAWNGRLLFCDEKWLLMGMDDIIIVSDKI